MFFARRIALLSAMLISGGLMIFPRVPLLFFMLAVCLLLSGSIWRIDRRLFAPVVLLALLFIFALAHPSGIDAASVATRFGNFVGAVALLAVYLRSRDDALADDLMALMPWMAVQAVITVPLAVLFPFLFIEVDINETPYRSLLLVFNYHVLNEEATTLPRPDGFFFEPGVFQMYLNLYLLVSLFYRRDIRHAMLAVAGVLSTQSSTGMVVMTMIVVAYYVRSVRFGGFWRRIMVFSGGALIAAVLGAIAFQNISQKLVGADRGSAWAREYDTLTGLAVAAAHPVVGVGFTHESYYRSADELGFAGTALRGEMLIDRGNSNGVVTVLYSVGLPLGLLLIALLFRQSLLVTGWLAGAAVFLSMLTEALFWSPFVMMLVLSGLTKFHWRSASGRGPIGPAPASLAGIGRTRWRGGPA